MAFPSNLLSLVLVLSLASAFSARKLESAPSLAKRLKLEQEGPTSCWDSLLELQSCSSEVVLFFLNGQTRLGANCCAAITTIERHCWPAMLGTIGITSEESDVLRGYCDAADNDGAAPAPTSLHRCYTFPRLAKP